MTACKDARDRHRIQIDKLLLISIRRVGEPTAADFAAVVARLHSDGVARETIRKTLGAAAMTLDHAGIIPNPVRDRSIKLPREEPEEINPPSAAHVEAVYRLIPSRHRLPLLWLDWSGARVSSVDLTRVGDYDEPRRRLRLRAATTKTRQRSGSTSTPPSGTPSSWRSARARTATPTPACSPRAGPMRSARPSPPADLADARPRHPVGENRRVRRAARPDRDRTPGATTFWMSRPVAVHSR